MISWIQRTFQQHFKIFFLILLGVTIVSFVATIGNMPGLGEAGPKTIKRSFFGYNLDQQNTASEVYNDADISAQLQTGFARLNNTQLQQYAFERIAALALADELNLPSPTQEQVVDYIKGLPAFAGPHGKFDPSRYASFRDNLETNPGIGAGAIARVLKDDVRIAHVRKLLGGPGYVLPEEIKDQLIQADSKWTVAVASVDFDSFKPAIAVNEDALKSFYSANAFRYTVPPRVGVDYVVFPAERYLPKVKVTPAQVRAYYDAHRSEFPAPSKKTSAAGKKSLKLNVEKSTNPDADFAAVQPKVKQALEEQRAKHMAAEAAADLTVAVYNQKLKPGTADFTTLLTSLGLKLKSAPPFDQATAPKDLGWSPAVIDEALKLDASNPMSDALPVTGGSVVLFWRNTLPSYQPQLEQVHDHVVADYKENERRKEFVAFGQKLHDLLEAGLKKGDTLKAAAAAVPVKPDQPKIEVKDYPAFTLRQPPEHLNPAILNALGNLHQGQLSAMAIADKKGFLVYAKDRELPDTVPGSPLYSKTREQMASLTASLNQNLYLNEIVMRELKKAHFTSS